MNDQTTKVRNWGATLLCLAAAGCSGGTAYDEAVATRADALAAAEPGEILRHFDGRDDRAVVPQRAEYDFGTGDFTLAVTAKVTNPASQTVVPLISKRRAGYPYDGFYFIVYGNQLLLQIRGANTLSSPIPSLRNGEWRHLAVRRQGGTLTFFVDGAAVGTGTNAGNATGPVDMTFGYDSLDGRGLRGTLGARRRARSKHRSPRRARATGVRASSGRNAWLSCFDRGGTPPRRPCQLGAAVL